MTEHQSRIHQARHDVVGAAVRWREAVLKKDPEAPKLLKEHKAAIDRYRSAR